MNDIFLSEHIVFLDIDGVLNSEKLIADRDALHLAHPPVEGCQCYTIEAMIDPRNIVCLNAIVTRCKAKVCISSSWRKLVDHDEIKRLLVLHGFIGEVVGATPDLINDAEWLAENRWGKEAYERIERGHEIWHWLVNNPHVTKFVILDDVADMNVLATAFVHTDDRVGLTEPDVERAVWLFETESPTLIAGMRGGCDHNITFDVDAARGLSAHEVRKRWPRLEGRCRKGCGYSGTYYASTMHYISGDW